MNVDVLASFPLRFAWISCGDFVDLCYMHAAIMAHVVLDSL